MRAEAGRPIGRLHRKDKLFGDCRSRTGCSVYATGFSPIQVSSDLQALLQAKPNIILYKPFPIYPSSVRDVSLLVKRETSRTLDG